MTKTMMFVAGVGKIQASQDDTQRALRKQLKFYDTFGQKLQCVDQEAYDCSMLMKKKILSNFCDKNLTQTQSSLVTQILKY